MIKYIALVPAYKPETLMLSLLRELADAGFDSVVINDGSGEEFDPLFKEASEYATVLTHPQNMGKGQGIRTGLAHIYEKYGNDCVVVTVDADGQHKVPDALELCRRTEAAPDTLFLGSRKLVGDVPFRSRIGNGLTRIVYRISTGLKVHDTQTGLRAFSGEMIPTMLEIKGNRYEYEMNVLLDFARDGIPIEEMEIETIYINNNEGSHFNPLKDSFRVYKEILKFSASSIISFLVDYILCMVLLGFTGNVFIANISSRAVSSIVNYTINKRFVFKKKGNLLRSAIGYFLLVAILLVGNTALLYVLVDICGIDGWLSKLITEATFFLISWFMQKFVIFKSKRKKK